MAIHRTELQVDRDFTIMPNAWARDRRLSRKARGLLVELLSHQVGWSVTVASLVESGTEGRDAVRSAIAELEDAGYLHRYQVVGADGRFLSVEYDLHNPSSDNPTSDEPPYKKTNSLKEKSSTTTTASDGEERATSRQARYLRDMLSKLGEEVDDVALSKLTRAEADAEIQRLEPRYNAWKSSASRRRTPRKPKLTAEQQQEKWLREHGVTAEEFEARKGDSEWLERIKRRGKVA